MHKNNKRPPASDHHAGPDLHNEWLSADTDRPGKHGGRSDSLDWPIGPEDEADQGSRGGGGSGGGSGSGSGNVGIARNRVEKPRPPPPKRGAKPTGTA